MTLAITEDDLAEGQESFQVVFDTAHATYPAGLTAGRAAFVAITDNEAPGLWVAAFRNTIAETETTTITIHATERLAATLTVPFTLGGTATTSTDYTLTDLGGNAVTSPLTFSSGQRSLTLTLSSINDGDATAETVIFTLTAPADDTAGYTLAAGRSHATTVTIGQLMPEVTFARLTEAERRISEGTAALELEVTLSGASGSEITVPITAIGDTATAGTDYTLTTTSVAFAADATGNDLTQTVTLAITDDDVYEGDETFTVAFGDLSSAGVRAGMVSRRRVEVTIADNDTLEAGFLAGTATVNEDAGTVELMFRLSATTTVDLVFPLVIAAGGSAERNRDYRLDATGITLVAGATGGDLTQTLSLPVLDDSIDEVDEMFTVSLDTAALPPRVTVPAATAFTGFAGVTVTVTDDDVPVVSVSALPGSVNEGETSTITVSSDRELATTLTIPFTIAGAGITDADYRLTDASGELVTSTLTLAAGSRAALLTLTTVIDEADTDPETLTWTLDTPAPDAGYTVGVPGAASLEITSSVAVATAVEFAPPYAVTVAEADDEVSVTVRLNTVLSSAITIPIMTTNGTAMAGEDYTAVTSVTLVPDAIMQTFSIPILNDILVETDETFTVSFGDLTTVGLVAGARRSVTVTITSEDMPILEVSAPTGDTLILNQGESIPITIRSTNGALLVDQIVRIDIRNPVGSFRLSGESPGYDIFDSNGDMLLRDGTAGFTLQAGGEEWTYTLGAVPTGVAGISSADFLITIAGIFHINVVFPTKTFRFYDPSSAPPVGRRFPDYHYGRGRSRHDHDHSGYGAGGQTSAGIVYPGRDGGARRLHAGGCGRHGGVVACCFAGGGHIDGTDADGGHRCGYGGGGTDIHADRWGRLPTGQCQWNSDGDDRSAAPESGVRIRGICDRRALSHVRDKGGIDRHAGDRCHDSDPDDGRYDNSRRGLHGTDHGERDVSSHGQRR